MREKTLNKIFLNKLDGVSHTKKIFKTLNTFNSKYKDFEKFIIDFEEYLSNKINVPADDLSIQDKIFEGIIYRLDNLSEHKNLVLKIYLESQKNPKFFIIINKYIHKYFNNFIRSPMDLATAYLIYVYAFNVWIEDNNDMDKTMAAIGNSFETLNKIKSFFNK